MRQFISLKHRATTLAEGLHFILFVLSLVFMSSCNLLKYTPEKARKQVIKADAYHPAIVAEYCGKNYGCEQILDRPDSTAPRTEDRPPQYRRDTVWADCPDTARTGRGSAETGRILRIPVACPPCDTARGLDHYIPYRDRGTEEALQAKLKTANDDAVKYKSQAKGRMNVIYALIAWGVLSLIAIIVLIIK
jgi:hypothetical protein